MTHKSFQLCFKTLYTKYKYLKITTPAIGVLVQVHTNVTRIWMQVYLKSKFIEENLNL